MTINRREFLKKATAGTGFAMAGRSIGATEALARAVAPGALAQGGTPDVVVVGAGAFGMWAALNLVRLGASVTVVDAYGAGNSRQTSGGGHPGRPHVVRRPTTRPAVDQVGGRGHPPLESVG